MELDIDFMVQGSSTYYNLKQIHLVLTLLQEYVDPQSIPDHVRQKVSGVDLTADDVLAIQDGRFHFSGSGFYMRMMKSGNHIAIDVVEEFYLVLPEVHSLDELRAYIEAEYEVVIDDYDLIDLYDGAFTIAGEETIDLTTEAHQFIPRSQCSEILWMVEEGCSADFVSKYVWCKYHARISPAEVTKLAWTHELTLAAKRWSRILSKRCQSSSFDAPCLKQTSRRKQPPLPIITATLTLPEPKVYAEQLKGGTYTANPDVLYHNNDGTYTTVDDFLAGIDSGGDFLDEDTSCSSSYTSDRGYDCGDESDPLWGLASWRAIRNSEQVRSNELTRNRESDSYSFSDWSLVTDKPPPLVAHGNQPGLQETPLQRSPGISSASMDTDSDTDLILDELDYRAGQQGNEDLKFSFGRHNSTKATTGDLPLLNPQTTIRNPSPNHHYGTPCVFPHQATVADNTDDGQSSVLFDQELSAKRKRKDCSPVNVDLEMGILHTVKADVETDLENGNLIDEQRSRKKSKRHSRLSGCGGQVQ